jgi:hypothetical protein
VTIAAVAAATTYVLAFLVMLRRTRLRLSPYSVIEP